MGFAGFVRPAAGLSLLFSAVVAACVAFVPAAFADDSASVPSEAACGHSAPAVGPGSSSGDTGALPEGGGDAAAGGPAQEAEAETAPVPEAEAAPEPAPAPQPAPEAAPEAGAAPAPQPAPAPGTAPGAPAGPAAGAAAGTAPAAKAQAASPSVSYRSHVSGRGWKAYASNGGSSGGASTGGNLQAVRIKVSGIDGGVSYRVYYKGSGWQSTRIGGAAAGRTSGGSCFNALRARLTGPAAQSYDLFYRVYLRGVGWLGWARNWESAGNGGYGRPLQSLQMRLVRKCDPRPSSKGSVVPVAYAGAPKVSASANVKGTGWTPAAGNSKVAGAPGKGRPARAVRVSASRKGLSGGISARVHMLGGSWRPYAANGRGTGSLAASAAVDGLGMRLTGGMADLYDLHYRAYLKGYGWTRWAKGGTVLGAYGRNRTVEGYRVYVTLKGSPAPVSYPPVPAGTYIYLDAGHGPSGGAGYDPGAVSGGYVEADETRNLVGKVAYYAKRLYGLKVYNNSNCNLNFTERQADAQRRGCTAFLPIHFNAGGGTGMETYRSSQYGAKGSARFQDIVHGNLAAAIGLTDRGKKDNSFSVLCGRVPAVLCEIAFLDNPSDMSRYKSRVNTVAKALAKSIFQAARAGVRA